MSNSDWKNDIYILTLNRYEVDVFLAAIDPFVKQISDNNKKTPTETGIMLETFFEHMTNKIKETLNS